MTVDRGVSHSDHGESGICIMVLCMHKTGLANEWSRPVHEFWMEWKYIVRFITRYNGVRNGLMRISQGSVKDQSTVSILVLIIATRE